MNGRQAIIINIMLLRPALMEPHSVTIKKLPLIMLSAGPWYAVVKAVCLESRRSRVRIPLWPSRFKESKCFFRAHS